MAFNTIARAFVPFKTIARVSVEFKTTARVVAAFKAITIAFTAFKAFKEPLRHLRPLQATASVSISVIVSV